METLHKNLSNSSSDSFDAASRIVELATYNLANEIEGLQMELAILRGLQTDLRLGDRDPRRVAAVAVEVVAAVRGRLADLARDLDLASEPLLSRQQSLHLPTP